ncbi:mycofactocin-coupled SDR family oxidoreductase [Amycolatopsis thermophila]|uniref:SDR family mycofactocin-dependent oxidoreductase n=1 Tax=Amycolatopsis thermophila TaxID=206084 RepID=A0ABU0F587_9PSEU|nr:mycofactocin-coupled SDR family oxidoreductase [Amycolatopsis thermophila]MDQ0382756.1 SDR family mycofactocin-dependent oxidoreductase [Amycolatopsis thermophila]
MAGRVEGKVAFITGAARGQGRSHAVRLAAEGADIVAVDICAQIDGVPYPLATEADLAKTVRQVEELGRRIVAVQADVRDTASLAAAVTEGLAELGHIDIVCANAGITGPIGEPISDVNERVRLFEQVVDINLTGVYRTIELTKQPLIDNGPGGSVIITSSLAGLRALGAGGGYTEAKHGLVGMVRAYAHELAPHHIRVNSIHPSNVRTPMIVNDATVRAFRPDLKNPTLDEAAAALQTLNLMPVPYLEPEDISNAVLFLASDESRYITGIALPVDAGGAIK